MKDTRREFLQKVGVSAVALQLASVTTWAKNAKAEPVYDGPVLRVAILGLGSYATRVAEAMQGCTKAKLVGLISGTPDKLAKWQAKYNIPAKNCYNYQNFDDIKHNPDIDAVYVITPNALHPDFVIRTAKAGKHAISEKPMAANVQQAESMIAACKQAGVKLLVGYRMHFEPKTLEVIRMRKEGELGKIQFFQGLCGFRIGDPKQWRLNKELSGGGSMMDIGIYAVNGSRYMTGEEPIWVTAQETKTDPVKFKDGIDETIQFQFGFPSGATASCLSTYMQNNLDKFFLNGEHGYAEMQPSTNYGPIMGHTNQGELTQPTTVHQAVQMDEFSEIIFHDKQPPVPVDGYEAIKDLKIIAAVYEAAKTGKKVSISV
ncbi:Gfo/Idh/MocA family oxidoreductase [Mucilaginibacter sp. dw_454]|uniref:Gfo/Idh/MocA family protein n=1 Tax=Mucilaginibacter sp. dw_454 TaxID=2720079 RepID=UPI001BD672E4|nr:Gfo/Idh/MocA family oxidoreductase [Mucilaginibacter sp. dw_454]